MFALAMGVGVLLGGQFCATVEAPECLEVEQVVVERVVPGEVIYECPPEPEPEPQKVGKVGGDPAPKARRAKTLPEAAPPPDPLERQRLLAWVRDQSGDLDACRGTATDVHRLAVTLHLDEARAITRVDINAGQGEVPEGLLSCLRKRIGVWAPPAALVNDRSQVVFGLTF